MKWIKIEDRYPTEDQEFIVWGASFEEPSEFTFEDLGKLSPLDKQMVTHWMPWKAGKRPLPKPPEEQPPAKWCC